MSGIKNVIHKITHPGDDHHKASSKEGGSKAGSGANTTATAAGGDSHRKSTDMAETPLHFSSELNSPAVSGAHTPAVAGNVVHLQDKHHPSTHGQPQHTSSPLAKTDSRIGKKHKNDDGDLSRTDSKSSAAHDLHSHFLAIKDQVLGHKHSSSGSHSPRNSTDSHRPALTHQKTEEDVRALRVDRQVELHKEHLARELAYKVAYENDPLNKNYGFLNIDATPNANVQTAGRKDTLAEIARKQEGEQVFFRCRIQSVRHQSSKLAFIIFRQRYDELQGVLVITQDQVSENMVRFVERLPAETIVLVRAIVQNPQSVGQKDIHYTSIHNVEVKVHTLHVVSQVTMAPPFNIHDAARGDADFHADADHQHGHLVSSRMHFDNRVASLRTPVNQAIFQLRAALCSYFRTYLTERGFTEMQSSKLQQGAPESGASVFKVDYFKRTVSLAQSPQLAKQMAIAGDMRRVFEIGPVFRAENSQTMRHLTEFIGADIEMEIDNDYHEVIDMLDGVFKAMFKGLLTEHHDLVDVVKRKFPFEDPVIPEKTLRLTFAEGVKLLNDSGWREDGQLISEYEDFSTPTEKHLGKLIKEKYGTDYYIIDKFPASARPFYTMPDPDDPRVSNSADFFLRGQEILSGGQRVHHAPLLEERMKAAKIEPKDMVDYLNGFRWGCPPHGGGGIGVDRVLFLFLELGNIRWASLLPRDPKSFPSEGDLHGGKSLRGPEINLLDYDTALRRGDKVPPPSVEDLIATYGDAANTVYLDPSWEVWRDAVSGAVCGFKESEGHAISWGRPLCPDSMLKAVLKRYLEYLRKTRKLKPIFACIDETTEQILARDYDWRSLAVAAEERIDPTAHNPESAVSKSNLAKKINQAKNNGVKANICDSVPDEKVRAQINGRMEEWRNSREGKQMHTTSLLPWDDHSHRRYFYASDKQHKIVALVVLAQLAPQHGWQVKYSLSFPDAPSGSIELLLSTAITQLAEAGCHSATFGTSAATHLGQGSHQSAFKMKTLSKAYDAITSSFKLLTKPEFRAKFMSEQDMVYLAYPKHGGLGVGGIHAIVKALSEEPPKHDSSAKIDTKAEDKVPAEAK